MEITGWSWETYKSTPSWVVEAMVMRHNEKAKEAEAEAKKRRRR